MGVATKLARLGAATCHLLTYMAEMAFDGSAAPGSRTYMLPEDVSQHMDAVLVGRCMVEVTGRVITVPAELLSIAQLMLADALGIGIPRVRRGEGTVAIDTVFVEVHGDVVVVSAPCTGEVFEIECVVSHCADRGHWWERAMF